MMAQWRQWGSTNKNRIKIQGSTCVFRRLVLGGKWQYSAVIQCVPNRSETSTNHISKTSVTEFSNTSIKCDYSSRKKLIFASKFTGWHHLAPLTLMAPIRINIQSSVPFNSHLHNKSMADKIRKHISSSFKWTHGKLGNPYFSCS